MQAHDLCRLKILYEVDMKKTALLFIIVLVIASSGCGKTVSSTKGIVINSFTFSPAKLSNGEEGIISLEIQNLGGITAKEVEAHLYNIDSKTYFDIKKSDGTYSTKHSFADMVPPDKLNNIPSFPETAVWVVDNNGKRGAPEGLPIIFEPKVKVCYLYDTISTAEFTVISSDELRQQMQRGVYKEKQVITKSSEGPISIEILTPQPIKAEAGKKIKIHVKVRNTDKLNGLVYLNEYKTTDAEVSSSVDCTDPSVMKKQINRVKISIDIPDMPSVTFTPRVIRLLKGDGEEGTATFISDDIVDLSDVVQKEYHVVMTTSYGYFVESETSFTLEHDLI